MKKHHISSLEELTERAKDLEWFWRAVDEDIGIVWDKRYTQVLDVSRGIAWSKWFSDGRTNIYSSSVAKFAKLTPQQTAYHFVSEDGKKSSITYAELDSKASKLGNALKSLGIQKGDIIAIYLPMIEEAILCILAAAKIGAVQTVIFSGYSSESLHIRLQDCNAKVLLVTDGFYRKGQPVSQKQAVETALKDTAVERLVIVPYMGVDKYPESEKNIHYDKLLAGQSSVCDTTSLNSEDPLFILYTSGTTGKPKGVIHTHGGFSVFAGHQAAYLVDIQPQDVVLWPADIGWITGLVWNVYGMLIMGAGAVIYDGALDYPTQDRIWQMLSEYEATIFGISPTAVRYFKKNNITPREKFVLDKIKNIPTTGEPLDEDSWWWLYEKVGDSKIPIMNLSGGTEIGGAMLSVLPGMKLRPSTVGMPVPGMSLDVVDENQKTIHQTNGYLIVRAPWPAMTRGLLNDDSGYLKTYWSRFENVWFHGDYVYVDGDNLWYMRGRTDDVINVSGHRLSTAEIEHAIISHSKISDAASVAIPDKLTGEAIVIFFVSDDMVSKEEISQYISEKIGKVARPKHIIRLSDLPKTRTGKIMRRLLRARLLGEEPGDISSLENPKVLAEIAKLG